MDTSASTVLFAPTDMSDASLPAVVYAAELAKRLRARLVLFHVISTKEMNKELDEGKFVDTQLEDAREELIWWFAKAVPPETRGNLSVETIARIGRPEEEILTEVQSLQPGMIVMATHGRTGLRRAMFGSVAEAVLRHAPCPVLTIRTKLAEGENLAALEPGIPHPR